MSSSCSLRSGTEYSGPARHPAATPGISPARKIREKSHHRTRQRWFSRVAALLVILLPVHDACAEWLHEDADIMGTRITVELSHADAAIARQGVDAVMAEMRRIDNSMSPWIESSELARLNREAADHPVAVSEELFNLIKTSIEFSRLTGGAFDITFASVGFLYDYRKGVHPDALQRREATELINYRNLVLDDATHRISYSKPGVRIDLGGIAKGHAVDRCITLLQSLGIHQALVTAGGDSRMIGDRWGRPWSIGVRDPRNENKLVAVIPLEDVAVSTSGDYERYFEEDGIRYHHIINPESGDSARELRSVTIIGPDATTTDILSTSVFVLGLEKGLALVNRLPDIDAILVDRHGAMHYSEDLQPARKPESGARPAAAPVPD
ncbi:MAG TPA: FAD:protein FMN transferase [Gammaproteobacteria bacterium]|nr:FAD:protein FMN transferase [Gammaproteobacteria bacterium]